LCCENRIFNIDAKHCKEMPHENDRQDDSDHWIHWETHCKHRKTNSWSNGDTMILTKPFLKRKVHFSASFAHMVSVKYMFVWSFASKSARKGEWEQCARDRFRFGQRILSAELVISPILDRCHRERICAKIMSWSSQ
jgi:hypothetical protein